MSPGTYRGQNYWSSVGKSEDKWDQISCSFYPWSPANRGEICWGPFYIWRSLSDAGNRKPDHCDQRGWTWSHHIITITIIISSPHHHLMITITIIISSPSPVRHNNVVKVGVLPIHEKSIRSPDPREKLKKWWRSRWWRSIRSWRSWWWWERW